MVKASRPRTVKTLTIITRRDIIVDKLLKPCAEDDHSICTGWAVLRKEISPIDANYFLKCTCKCHKKKTVKAKIKKIQREQPQIKKKTKNKEKRKKSTKTKRSKRTRTRR
jgi:hypothetical protein